MAVNRARLRGLSGDELAKLAGSGDLDLVYAHLASQHNFNPTAERILRVIGQAPQHDAAAVLKPPSKLRKPLEAH